MSSTKYLLTILTIIFLTSVSSFAKSEPIGTTGKIMGKVTDVKGDPLAGAVIKIEGTQMGASADESGDYVILNVPVGTYSIKCTYVGFEPQIQTDVKVSADITTTVNFKLTEAGIKTEDIEVIAKRNTVSTDQSGQIITSEEIINTGIRGIENIAAKTAGVVQDERGTSINIRGGRDNETAVIIDGVLTTNPLNGNSTAYVSNNLLQEMAVLTGGFSAEYGNVLSGVINVTTKSGLKKYSGVFEVVSDDFYERILDANKTGYNLYSANIGGPLIPTKKLNGFMSFYGGVERNFFLQNNPSWITKELNLPENILPGYSNKTWAGNGKLTVDFTALNPKLNLKLIGGANISETNRFGFFQVYMLNNSHRDPLITEKNMQFYGKIVHQITPKVFYEVQGNYFKTEYFEGDAEFGEDFYKYGNPYYVTGLNTKGAMIGMDPYGLFAKYNRVRNRYSKSQTSYIEGSFNLVAQYKANEIKFGGSYRYHTIRHYEVRPVSLSGFYTYPLDSLGNEILSGTPTAPGRNIFTGASGLANFWGYTYDGQGYDNSTATGEGSMDGAKHPIIAALYLQDKIELKDFILNAGIRFDFLDPNTWRIKDISHIVRFGDPTKLDIEDFDLDSDPTYAISPRLGFSFPVTENAVFHAQYGKFIQLPQLEYLYNGYDNLSYWLNSAGFSGSFGNPNLEPEKTTAFEVGIKQILGDKLSVDITAFYKETKDLIGIKKYPQLPNQIQVYANQDYGTIKGLDIAIDFRRTTNLAFSIAYSLSYASGTGSDPNSASTAAWLGTEQPKLTYPLSYDQRHTGTVNIDYRFGSENLPKGVWGAILSRLGFNLLYTFNSGRPYSMKNPAGNPFVSTGGGAQLESTINGAYGPWNHRLDFKIDKSIMVKVSESYKLDFNFYMYVINALNYELVNSVWAGSGDPGVTGYLSTQQGIDQANSYDTDPYSYTSSQEFIYLYGLRSMQIDRYGPPRQVRFGVRLSF